VAEQTYKQILNRLQDIEDEVDRLAAIDDDDLTPEQEARWHEINDEWEELDRERKRLERDEDRARIKRAKIADVARGAAGRSGATGTRVYGGADAGPTGEPDSVKEGRFRDPWDTSEIRMGLSLAARTSELRSRARSAIEKMPATTSERREVMTKIIDRYDTKDARLSQLALATSSEAYVRAFGKLISNQGAVAILDKDEMDAYQRAENFRAMSLTDTAGGFLVPFQLDPTVIITAAGSFNQVRQIAREVIATGDVWSGISSAGVTGQWTAEATETTESTPVLAQPTVPVHKLDVFVGISIEAAMDAENVAQEVAEMIAFEKERLESVAFVTGSGIGQPTGIITALTAGSSVVASAGADVFAVADVYALDGALPARYRFNASWLAHRLVYNLMRRFDTQGGASLWTTLGQGMPAALLGRPNFEAEAMDGTITALADNLLAVYGDFTNYVVADRIGTTIEFIPHLFGPNRRPTGQRGWYAYARVGADSVNDGAFRMLNVT
jgi:HK97 family phage major capsid protein